MNFELMIKCVRCVWSICHGSPELPLKSKIEKTNFIKKKKRFWKNENWKIKHIFTHLTTQSGNTINGSSNVYIYPFITYYKIKNIYIYTTRQRADAVKMRPSMKKRWHIQMSIFAHWVIISYKIVHLRSLIKTLLTLIK